MKYVRNRCLGTSGRRTLGSEVISMVIVESNRTRTSPALALGTVFRDAWVSRDLGQLATMLAPDCLYSTTNGPAPGTEYRGRPAVPSVFTWPNVIFEAGSQGPSSLTYAARGVGKIWGASDAQAADDDALGALLGRSRAAILTCLELPHSITELALRLGQSPPSISQHLSVLRRSGLVISWRSGRSVLYRRTALAGSIVEASGSSAVAG
jgi:DNA-binding transcriptional ArsR family regulator